MITASCRHRTIVIGVLACWLAVGVSGAAPQSPVRIYDAGSHVLTLDSRQERVLKLPRAAFNTVDGSFLAVWEYHYAATDWDINGRVLDATGQPLGEAFGIAWGGTIMQEEADVAYNPVTNEFLVVYALSPGNWNVSACLVAGDGMPGGFIHVADTSFSELSPRVACDPIMAQYLVVYEREHMLDKVVWREVWGQRLMSNGTRVGSPFMLSAPGTHSEGCSVACAGGQFLVVWQEEQPDGRGRIRSRIIQCGAPSKTTVTVSELDEEQRTASVAYDPGRAEYLVVYEAKPRGAGRWTIEGSRINTLGEPKGSQVIASSADESCTAPDVAYDPADATYVVVWVQEASDVLSLVPAHRIMAIRVDGGGAPVGDPEAVPNPNESRGVSYGSPRPAVAFGRCQRGLVVWEDRNTTWNPDASSTTTYCILGATDTWGVLGCDSDGADDVDLAATAD